MHVPFTASVVPQEFVCAKADALAPLKVTLVILSAALPGLESVIVCVAEDAFTTVLGKVILLVVIRPSDVEAGAVGLPAQPQRVERPIPRNDAMNVRRSI